jgi:hypothetical protein
MDDGRVRFRGDECCVDWSSNRPWLEVGVAQWTDGVATSGRCGPAAAPRMGCLRRWVVAPSAAEEVEGFGSAVAAVGPDPRR